MENQKQTSKRKADHIDLALASQVLKHDDRFYYEPLLAGHSSKEKTDLTFLSKKLGAPIWISSMTGGSAEGGKINKNLAKACAKHQLGMGLGSCRIILENDDHLSDFQMRPLIGDQPFYANLGIAQIEESIQSNKLSQISEMLDKLDADGLIIHVNPLQEWMQPEGDQIDEAPIESIKRLIDLMDVSLIIKEVGQGMGPKSLEALSQLPIDAIEFAAHGGTNFSKLEMKRDNNYEAIWKDVSSIGHSNEEMIQYWNSINNIQKSKIDIIISGGINNYLDGYYFCEKLSGNAIYGQASAFLKYANESFELLDRYIESQKEGLKMAQQFLSIK